MKRSSPRPRPYLRWLLYLSPVLLAGGGVFADWWFCLPEETTANYVGGQRCVACHTKEANQWQGSHHDLAMEPATEETVLADFDDAEFTHHDVTSRMFRRDGKFLITTEGPTGELADFEVKYVFGHTPLQQYLVEFDRPAEMPENEVARLQVLRISWDTEKGEWFYLPPPDVEEKLSPDDDLHWTGVAQRWNNMCADCHSTNLRRGFDLKTKTYHTTFTDIDVNCEACHGPGSVHVQLAEQTSLFWDRKLGYGLAKLKDPDTDHQIHACAQCHSRRRVLQEGYHPSEDFYDYFATELPQRQTYHPDGQILDEVYVHGSFIQSKMYHKNIRCTDCHDPHTARLKHDGNKVCTSCHQHAAGKYDTPSHHRHKTGSTGASCVNCHMPSTTYMEVDPRRDHSLRIPRPDLSVALGTPNACTGCHLKPENLSAEKRGKLRRYQDWLLAARPLEGPADEEVLRELQRLDTWAAEATEKWYPNSKARTKHYGEVLGPAWHGQADPKAVTELLRSRDVPALIRATALLDVSQLGQFQDWKKLVADRGLADSNPIVRAAAITGIEPVIPSRLEIDSDRLSPAALSNLADNVTPVTEILWPMLSDRSFLVRTEAARVLSRIHPQLLPAISDGARREQLDAAIEEYRRSVLTHGDRAGSYAVLANMYENLGRDDRAENYYQVAIRLEPGLVGPRTNLAALLDRKSREAQQNAQQAAVQRDRERAEKFARQYAQWQTEAAILRREELPLLARDAELAPYNAAIQYRYGLSLYLNGDNQEALTALLRARELEPANPQYLLMVTLLLQKMERYEEALGYATALVKAAPQHTALLEQLKLQAAGLAPEAPPGN